MDSTGDDSVDYALANRKSRGMLLLTTSSLLGLTVIPPLSAQAAFDDVFKKKGLYVLNTKDNESASLLNSEAIRVFPKLSSEYALLRVLPVKYVIFRTIEQNLESSSALPYRPDMEAWAKAESSIDTALSILVSKRSQLEPIINLEDSTEVTVIKAKRGEIIFRDLNHDLEYLKESVYQ